MDDDNFLHVDGSILEGGGQILRQSIALSAILGIPIRVTNIRAGRSKPGLAAQHLIGIKLVADMCKATLKGAMIGSTEVEFTPRKKIRGGHYVADTRTAGSISLLMQVAIPCALFADGPVTLDLKGGTNAEMAPQIDYMTEVFAPFLRRFGASFDVTIHRRGYYPKGGGHVTVEVKPVQRLTAVNIVDRGEISRIYGWSFVSGTLPLRLAHQMYEGFKSSLQDLGHPLEIKVYKEDPNVAPHNCSGIMAVCELTSGCVLGADALGRRGAEPAALGRHTADTLRTAIHSAACLDTHAQDQLIIYMALAEGRSVIKVSEITMHTKTAMYIAELVAKVQFTVQPGKDHGENLIECSGIRFVNKHYVDSTHNHNMR